MLTLCYLLHKLLTFTIKITFTLPYQISPFIIKVYFTHPKTPGICKFKTSEYMTPITGPGKNQIQNILN
jgi:hypothetical protein